MCTSFVIRRFEDLSTDELYEILRARADVFIAEERILYPDADGLDRGAIHVFSQDEAGVVIAYLRMFPKEDEPGIYQMGRILTRVHGKGLGRQLMQAAMDHAFAVLGADGLYMNSQAHAVGFYQKLGFQVTSDPFMEAGIPHVQMRYSKG